MVIQKRPIAGLAAALLLAGAVTACGSASAQPPPQCTPTYVYSHVKNQGSALYVLDVETDYNGTSQAEPFTPIDKRSGSFSIEDSTASVTRVDADVDAVGQVSDLDSEFAEMPQPEASAAFSYVQGTDHSVQTTTSLTIGSTVRLDVPPGATGYALFGVVVKITNGNVRSSNCPSLQQNSHETVILPEESEWCTWIRGPDVFTDGGRSHCVVVAYDLAH
jgi:hypothetical protein